MTWRCSAIGSITRGSQSSKTAVKWCRNTSGVPPRGPSVDDLASLGVDRKRCVRGSEIRVEGGLGEPGLDQQDADSVLAHLVVDRLGVALESVLARRVQRHVGDGNETNDRADVDDPSAVLLAPPRQYGAGHAA